MNRIIHYCLPNVFPPLLSSRLPKSRWRTNRRTRTNSRLSKEKTSIYHIASHRIAANHITSHPENTKLGARLLGAAAQGSLEAETEHVPGLRGRDDAVVPEPGG